MKYRRWRELVELILGKTEKSLRTSKEKAKNVWEGVNFYVGDTKTLWSELFWVLVRPDGFQKRRNRFKKKVQVLTEEVRFETGSQYANNEHQSHARYLGKDAKTSGGRKYGIKGFEKETAAATLKQEIWEQLDPVTSTRPRVPEKRPGRRSAKRPLRRMSSRPLHAPNAKREKKSREGPQARARGERPARIEHSCSKVKEREDAASAGNMKKPDLINHKNNRGPTPDTSAELCTGIMKLATVRTQGERVTILPATPKRRCSNEKSNEEEDRLDERSGILVN